MQSNPNALRLMLLCEVFRGGFTLRGVFCLFVLKFVVIVMAVVCCVASGSISLEDVPVILSTDYVHVFP